MIEVFKALTAAFWPAAFLWALWRFENEIRKLLSSATDRTWKVNLPGGIGAALEHSSVQQAPTLERGTSLLTEMEPLQEHEREAVNLVEEALRGQIAEIPDARKIGSLLRALAIEQIGRNHESAYNRIFGSQLTFLKFLNSSRGISLDNARKYFLAYTEKMQDFYKNVPFEQWLAFLESYALIEVREDEITITKLGRDFLTYILEVQLNDWRPF